MAAPGVVVVHDWYGLLPHTLSYAERLRDAGLQAVAVDLYDGRSTTDADEAEALMNGLDSAAAERTVAEAVRALRSDGGAPRIGAVGFSMGGMVVLRAAARGAFDAAVAYYAALTPDAAASFPCPVQLHLAAVDDWDPPDFPEQFAAALREHGTAVEVHGYPSTEHSFANDDVRFFDPVAAALALERSIDFLRRVLGA